MEKYTKLKEFLRFLTVNFCLYFFNFFSFKYLLVNQENYINFISSINFDLIRFLNFNLSYDFLYFLFVLSMSLFVSLIIFFSDVFTNPYKKLDSKYNKYIKLFQLTTLSTVLILYFLRVFNLSRFNLIIYFFLIPLIFLFFDSGGIFSQRILRQHNPQKYILINFKKVFSKEVFMNNYLFNKELVKKVSVTPQLNLLDELIGFQKYIQFDFLVITIEEINKNNINLLVNLTKLKKPIYLIVDKTVENDIIRKLVVNKLPDNFLNIYFINPIVQDGLQFLIKRSIDLAISTFGIVLFTIPMIFISLFIFAQDRHNPIVKIPRSGIFGNNFEMYKFRTMKPNAHKNRKTLNSENQRTGPLFKLDNDPRIIPRLKWIRVYSLDELPQLFNVFKGEMSIVGPRPLFAEDLQKFRDEETIRLTVLPGMTGLLQINNRETQDFNKWFYFDKQYIDNWSVLLDIKIILITPFKIKSSI